MLRRPPRATRTDTLCPCPTLCRAGHASDAGDAWRHRSRSGGLVLSVVMRFARTGRPAVISVSLLALFLPLGAASAQEVDRGTSALDLPRPGYEPRRMRFGTTTIAPELRVQSVYESTVVATPANEDDEDRTSAVGGKSGSV